jgi:tRNA (Thr-GGU) A37 N-methylase
VSRVTVYAHFPTSEALLEAAVDRAVRQTMTALNAARLDEGRPAEALDRMIRASWEHLARYAGMAGAVAEQLDPEAVARTHQAGHQAVGALIDRGRADGSFRADVPTGWLVTACIALIHACAAEVRAGRIGKAEAAEEDNWGAVVARLVLDPSMVDPDAVLGLGEFSHLEVVFHFHTEQRIRRGAAHPRGNPAWPEVGVLAGHSPVRPNHLGVSRCSLLSVDGLELTVRGLDAIDGTPILDIKPWMTEFAPAGAVREPAWARELMANYY